MNSLFLASWALALIFSSSPDQGRVSNIQDQSQCRSDWIDLDQASVTLRGRLEREVKFGPPGFGENPSQDSSVSVIFLKLDRGINTIVPGGGGTEGKRIGCVTKIQVVFNAYLPLEVFLGARVVIEGQLTEAQTSNEFTPVVIWASKIFAEPQL